MSERVRKLNLEPRKFRPLEPMKKQEQEEPSHPPPPPPAATGHRIPARNWRDREREGEENRPHPHVDNQVFPWATEDDGDDEEGDKKR
jgi:hypothetical protein